MLFYLRGVLLVKVGGGAPLLDVDADTLAQMRAVAATFTMPRLVQAIRLFSQAAAELRISIQPQLPLELAFVEAAMSSPEPMPQAAVESVEARSKPMVSPAPESVSTQPSPAAPLPSVRPVKRDPGSPAAQDKMRGSDKLALLRNSWGMVRQELQAKSPAALGLLSSRRGVRFLAVEGQQVIIGYQEQARYSVEQVLLQPKVVEALEQALSKVFGSPHFVKYVPEKSYQMAAELQPSAGKASVSPPSEAQKIDPLVETAINEWGAKAEHL